MSEELVIDEKNFNEYFRDVRQVSPRAGEVMACYRANAEFINGIEKKQMLQLIKLEGKMAAASQVMRKLLFASELDAVRVPKNMIQDLLDGMTDEQVLEKTYPYLAEMFYYAKPEHVPKDDPHWSIIQIVNLNDFLKSKIVNPEVMGE
jgi:hypothetical protein